MNMVYVRSKGNKTKDNVTRETRTSLILIIELNLNVAYQREQTENSRELK